jgi:aminopeptidase N
MGRLWILLLSLAIGLHSCGGKDPDALRVANHSFSQPDEVVVEHIDLDLEVDFDRERIGGRATLHIHNKRDSDRLVLDTRELNIERVTLGHSEAPADFVIGESVEFLGQPLVIDITPQTELVHID